MLEQHVDATDSAVGHAHPVATGRAERQQFVKVMPRDYKRVLEAIAEAEQNGTRRRRGDHGGGAWLIPPVPQAHRQREPPTRRPVPLRLRDWKEVYEDFAHDTLRGAGRALHGLRHSVLPQRLPAGQPDSGVERPGLRDRWREAIERLHATNNFPEFTGRLCPAPCEASCVLGINQDPVTIKQVEVEIIDNAFDEGWVVPRAAAIADRQDGRGRRLRSGRSGRRPAADPRRAHGDGVRARRPHRRPAALRHPRVQDGEAPHRPPARADGGRGHEFRAGVNVGVDITAEQLRADFDAVVLAGGATAARDLPIPGRELDGIHQAMEYLPWANRVQEGDDVSAPTASRRSPPRARRSSSSAAATPAPTAWAPCTARARPSVHQFEIMPRPPETRAESTPWPTYPLMFRVSSAHEEGGERVFSVNTEEFVGRDGRVDAPAVHEVTMEDGKFDKVDGTDFELEADLVLLAMGFVGPEREGLLTDLGVELTERGNVARDDDFETIGARRLRRRRHGPRPVADRLGDRRGPGRRGRGGPVS